MEKETERRGNEAEMGPRRQQQRDPERDRGRETREETKHPSRSQRRRDAANKAEGMEGALPRTVGFFLLFAMNVLHWWDFRCSLKMEFTFL